MKSLFTLLSPKTIAFFAFFLLLGIMANAQLKIGDNPTSIHKSSILELESSRQGLLLPRLSDTAAINLLTPPDGMIIYLNSDNSLRLRSSGSWKKIADLGEASSNWSLTGNSGTDSTKFLGTIDGKPLMMRTNNTERLRIDANGNVGIGTSNPTATLNVNGSVKFDTLTTGTNELQVLVLAADGSVYKRTMSSSAFENAIKAINGIQRQTLTITAAADATQDSVKIINNAADSTIGIYLPVQNGASANKPYGFLTLPDWQKIQSAIQTITIGAVATASDAKGATIDSTGTTRVITLHPADATNPGIVTAGTQTFGGNKTFAGTVTLDSVATNSTLDSVLVISNGLVQKRQVSAAAFGDAIRHINGNSDTAQTISFRNVGRDLTVSTNGTNAIYLNVPDASDTARGVVTTTAQIFGGNKTFGDSVAARAVLIGNAGNANSTMQVNGSLAMAIKTVTGSYTATVADNTILADATTTAATVTLPAATGIAGRIYTIKKVGTGGLDNQLTITPGSGSTIDGGASFVIYNDWSYVTLQTDGTNWFIIRK